MTTYTSIHYGISISTTQSLKVKYTISVLLFALYCAICTLCVRHVRIVTL